MTRKRKANQNNVSKEASVVLEDAQSNAPSSGLGGADSLETPISPKTPIHTRLGSSATLVDQEIGHEHPPVPATSQSALEIASMLAMMKETASALAEAMQAMQPLPEKLSDLAGGMRARDQLRSLQERWKEQMDRQNTEIGAMEARLKQAVVASVRESIKEKAYEVVRPRIAEKVRQRVREELAQVAIMPAEQQVQKHTRIIEETQVLLHNVNARRENSNMLSANSILSPLLPSPSQSILTPGALPTPLSPRFPTDLKGILSLKPEEVKGLLKGYGLPETPTRDPEGNINQILSYIGVHQPIYGPQTYIGRRQRPRIKIGNQATLEAHYEQE